MRHRCKDVVALHSSTKGCVLMPGVEIYSQLRVCRPLLNGQSVEIKPHTDRLR